METWRAERYAAAGLPASWTQDNLSQSRRGVVRELHGQCRPGQGKLVTALAGRIWDVAVDLRRGSPTFARSVVTELDAERFRQLYIPPGLVHGFCTPWEEAPVGYKAPVPWNPHGEFTVRWDDPTLAIPWPVRDPVLSSGNASAPFLDALPERFLTDHASMPPR